MKRVRLGKTNAKSIFQKRLVARFGRAVVPVLQGTLCHGAHLHKCVENQKPANRCSFLSNERTTEMLGGYNAIMPTESMILHKNMQSLTGI